MKSLKTSLQTSVGRILRAHRKAAHLTLMEVGSRAHISYSMLSRMERGEHPMTLAHLERLCRALSVHPADAIKDASAWTAPPDPGGDVFLAPKTSCFSAAGLSVQRRLQEVGHAAPHGENAVPPPKNPVAP